MAMTDSSAPVPGTGETQTGLLPSRYGLMYLIGLVLVFLGERALVATVAPRAIATGLGLVLLVTSATERLILALRKKGEAGRIARILSVAAWGGVVAVVLALATSSLGAAFVGLDRLEPEARATWDGLLTTTWVALLTMSVLPLLLGEAALLSMRRAPRPESRRVVWAALAGLSLGMALCYLSLFVYSAHRYGVAADYAYFKTAEPSQSTRRIAASLSQPVKVVAVFPSVNEVRNEVERYFHSLSRSTKKLQIEFQDRLLNPKLARELRVGQDGTVVFSRGEVRHLLTIGTELKKAKLSLRTLDQDVQKNLLKLARDARVAYLTIGHGEINDSRRDEQKREGRSTQLFKKLLEMQNYRLQDLGLSQGLGREIPSDAQLVMVLGPTEPFAPEEVRALSDYAKRGGRLFIALNPEPLADASATKPEPPGADAGAPPAAELAAAQLGQGGVVPNLSELAALFGLTFDSTVVANDRDFIQRQFNPSDRAQLVSNRFSSHASVTTLSRTASWVALFGAGSLTKVDDKDKTIDFAVRGLPGSFADTNGNFENDSDEKRESFNFAAAVARPVSGGAPDAQTSKGKPTSSSQEMRAFVVADADAFSDLVMMNVPTNRLWLLDAVRWLGGEESFAGEVNNEEDHRIEHTKDQDVVWFYATILGAPALVLAGGLFWARRSRRKESKR